MGILVRKKEPGRAWETESEGDSGGFDIGSSYLAVVGDHITTAMGSVTHQTWGAFAVEGSDLELDAGGRFINVLTDGWYATSLKVNISGAADQVQWARNLSSGGGGTMNAIDEYFSVDPALGVYDLTGAIGPEHFQAGETIDVVLFADNSGSSGDYDTGTQEMLLMITRLA